MDKMPLYFDMGILRKETEVPQGVATLVRLIHSRKLNDAEAVMNYGKGAFKADIRRMFRMGLLFEDGDKIFTNPQHRLLEKYLGEPEDEPEETKDLFADVGRNAENVVEYPAETTAEETAVEVTAEPVGVPTEAEANAEADAEADAEGEQATDTEAQQRSVADIVIANAERYTVYPEEIEPNEVNDMFLKLMKEQGWCFLSDADPFSDDVFQKTEDHAFVASTPEEALERLKNEGRDLSLLEVLNRAYTAFKQPLRGELFDIDWRAPVAFVPTVVGGKTRWVVFYAPPHADLTPLLSKGRDAVRRNRPFFLEEKEWVAVHDG